MSKHTPGPWKMRNRTGNHDWNNWRIAAEDGPGRVGGICRLDESLTGEESEANARLIAAAPELLEALRETLEFAIEANNRIQPPESKEEMESGFGCNSWTVDVFKRARAAIAKATAE